MRGAEPDTACVDDRQRLPRVGPEAVPVPDVHHAAEGEAEDAAERGERPAAANGSSGEGADDAATAPGEHLPRRPDPLAEVEVRDEGCDGTDREPDACA